MWWWWNPGLLHWANQYKRGSIASKKFPWFINLMHCTQMIFCHPGLSIRATFSRSINLLKIQDKWRREQQLNNKYQRALYWDLGFPCTAWEGRWQATGRGSGCVAKSWLPALTHNCPKPHTTVITLRSHQPSHHLPTVKSHRIKVAPII